LGVPSVGNLQTGSLVALGHAWIMQGQVWNEDGGTHTIDTTGSSSLGWRTVGITFANAGTTVKVGLAALDPANGPPARAVNVSNTITFNVSKSLVGGGGGITANAWQEHVPDSGSLSIAHGSLQAFCLQLAAFGGTDSITIAQVGSPSGGMARPGTTLWNASTYADQGRLPNAVITYSDGTRGYIYGGFVFNTLTAVVVSNAVANREFGNTIILPFPARVYGIIAASTLGTDIDLVLYSDPLGSPVAERTVSFDGNVVQGVASGTLMYGLFSTPYQMVAGQTVAAMLKPTTSVSQNVIAVTYNIAAHQGSQSPGAAGVNSVIRGSSGAFVQTNTQRAGVGLLVSAFDGGGLPASRLQLGH
jgi:hypothetical protein